MTWFPTVWITAFWQLNTDGSPLPQQTSTPPWPAASVRHGSLTLRPTTPTTFSVGTSDARAKTDANLNVSRDAPPFVSNEQHRGVPGVKMWPRRRNVRSDSPVRTKTVMKAQRRSSSMLVCPADWYTERKRRLVRQPSDWPHFSFSFHFFF